MKERAPSDAPVPLARPHPPPPRVPLPHLPPLRPLHLVPEPPRAAQRSEVRAVRGRGGVDCVEVGVEVARGLAREGECLLVEHFEAAGLERRGRGSVPAVEGQYPHSRAFSRGRESSPKKGEGKANAQSSSRHSCASHPRALGRPPSTRPCRTVSARRTAGGRAGSRAGG